MCGSGYVHLFKQLWQVDLHAAEVLQNGTNYTHCSFLTPDYQNSASEVTTLWHYTNLFIITIIIKMHSLTKL